MRPFLSKCARVTASGIYIFNMLIAGFKKQLMTLQEDGCTTVSHFIAVKDVFHLKKFQLPLPYVILRLGCVSPETSHQKEEKGGGVDKQHERRGLHTVAFL